MLLPGRRMLALAIWAGACTLHAAYYVVSTLALPDIPDAYARTVHFQLLMFAIFRLPLWLLALGILMISVTQRRSSNSAAAGAGHNGGIG